MKLKLQYDTFDEGEFTDEQDVDLNVALTTFEKNTELVKTKNSFTINRPYINFYLQKGENYLRIQHFAKDAFTVYYCNDPDDRLFNGNFYKKTVLNIISFFSNDQHDKLVNLIPRTSENEKVLINQFINDDFIYHYKKRGQFLLIFHTILYLPLALCFLISSISLVSKTYFFIFPLLFALFFFIMLIQLYRLHFNYIENSKNKTIKVSSGSPTIVVSEEEQSAIFNKTDIKEVVYYYNMATRSPFNEYNYSKIILKDGRTFDISHMIIDHWILNHKLKGVTTRDVKKYYPTIR